LGVLSNDVQIEFGEFGDWANVFTENKVQNMQWVVFMEDLFSLNRFLGGPESIWLDDLEVILQTLISRLKCGKNLR